MATGFSGFTPQALSFFRQLEKNNRREWFQPRKAAYEERVRAPMLALVEQINDALRSFAVDHVADPPARAIYRIYRDTRFSKDKTPYKTHIGALFPRHGLPKHGGANYYVGISHAGVDIAGGMYMPQPAELTAVRAAFVSRPREIQKLLADRTLRKLLGELQGEQLARVPKTYDVDTEPLASLLRHKQLYFFTQLPADAALDRRLAREVIRRFKAMSEAIDYLNGLILAAQQGEDDGRPKRPEPMF